MGQSIAEAWGCCDYPFRVQSSEYTGQDSGVRREERDNGDGSAAPTQKRLWDSNEVLSTGAEGLRARDVWKRVSSRSVSASVVGEACML